MVEYSYEGNPNRDMERKKEKPGRHNVAGIGVRHHNITNKPQSHGDTQFSKNELVYL